MNIPPYIIAIDPLGDSGKVFIIHTTLPRFVSYIDPSNSTTTTQRIAMHIDSDWSTAHIAAEVINGENHYKAQKRLYSSDYPNFFEPTEETGHRQLPEYILGEDFSSKGSRIYILHTTRPQFIAKIETDKNGIMHINNPDFFGKNYDEMEKMLALQQVVGYYGEYTTTDGPLSQVQDFLKSAKRL